MSRRIPPEIRGTRTGIDSSRGAIGVGHVRAVDLAEQLGGIPEEVVDAHTGLGVVGVSRAGGRGVDGAVDLAFDFGFRPSGVAFARTGGVSRGAGLIKVGVCITVHHTQSVCGIPGRIVEACAGFVARTGTFYVEEWI